LLPKKTLKKRLSEALIKIKIKILTMMIIQIKEIFIKSKHQKKIKNIEI
jgi:hypothetical protein